MAESKPTLGRPWIPSGRAAAFAVIAGGYLAAGAVAASVAVALAGAPSWQRMAAADLAATLVVFVLSVLYDNSSFYDPYWSVAPIPIVVWLALDSSAPLARRALVVALVIAWGARLTWNWTRSWSGFSHEDWRYVELRRKTGRAYWLVSLLGLHGMPTVTVFLCLLPLWPALASFAPLGPLDLAAVALTAGAIALEATADAQLRAFRRGDHPPGAIFAAGLWARCRHPNYLGEISFWWGLFLFGVAAEPRAWWWLAIGPLWMTIMFAFISVPMIDRRSLERRPGYAEHMKRVPSLWLRL
jgi:steroid 5-alpha reductase family enzyme